VAAGKPRASRPAAQAAGGDDAGPDDPGGSQEGKVPEVHATDYKGLQMLSVACEPDLVVLFMPALGGPVAEGEPGTVPEHILSAVSDVPAIVTTRCALPEATVRLLRSRLHGSQLLLPPVRCPFSAAAGDPVIKYDDNGWIFGVQGTGALATALNIHVRPDYPGRVPEWSKVPALFWGILDIKYDPRLPVFERVKVLESGDGRISKFSGDGADIARRAKEHYRLEEGLVLRKYHVVSADKRLTHDLMELSGYEHLVPMQACFDRRYDPELATRIAAALGVEEGDNVVLKLCNRSRSAGVLIVPIDELDEVLEEILVPPGNMESWFREQTSRLAQRSAADLGFDRGAFDEQCRHWWSNESPSFVVERCCASIPTWREGRPFDGTMRVGFTLRRSKGQPSSTAALAPEDLEVEWLGGYWKLPKSDMESDGLRERIISAARTSGTAPVCDAHLFEVYAALGDSVQHLFGGAEPTPKTYEAQYRPELAAFMTARLGMSMSEPAKAREMLSVAESSVARRPGAAMKACVESFIKRARGILLAKEIESNAAERWDSALPLLKTSLKSFPTNANTLYLLGMASLDKGQPEEAVDLLNRSLLLDPDFRAPYVNLGVAYLRLRQFDRAIEISDAGLARHPQSYQCHYHIGVASCQLAVLLDVKEVQGSELTPEEDSQYEELRQRAHTLLSEARESPEGKKRIPMPGKSKLAPWQPSDQQMIDAMATPSRPGKMIELPANVGWRYYSWRT